MEDEEEGELEVTPKGLTWAPGHWSLQEEKEGEQRRSRARVWLYREISNDDARGAMHCGIFSICLHTLHPIGGLHACVLNS